MLFKQRRVYKFFQTLGDAEDTNDKYLGALFSSVPVLDLLAQKLSNLDKKKESK